MSYVKIELAHDDHIALRAFGKALEEMALAHGAEPRETTVGEMTYKLNIDTTEATAALEELHQHCAVRLDDQQVEELREKLKTTRSEPEIDTTTQHVESLTGTEERFDETATFAEIAEAAPTTDNSGTRWDERIHSASKALNSDGTWRLRRKPKDMGDMEWSEYVKSIQSVLSGETPTREECDELIQVSNEMLEKIREEVEPPVTPPGDDFHTDAGVVTEQTVAGIPPLPVPPPVALPGSTGATDLLPPPPVGTAVTQPTWDFPRLMTFLTERHGKIDVATVNTLLAQDGLASLQELNAHPDKIGPFVARVKAHLGE